MSDSCRMSFSVSFAIAFEDKTACPPRFAPLFTEKSRIAGFWQPAVSRWALG
jgi:hypothetical protein